jgi:hypothetical protein
MKFVLFYFAILILTNYESFSQPISGVSLTEKDSIVKIVREKRKEEQTLSLLYLYDQVDTSLNIFKLYYTTLYDLNGFDFSKNILDYVKIGDEYKMYFYKTNSNSDSIMSYIESSKDEFGLLFIVLKSEKEKYNSLLRKININNATVFAIAGCKDLFISIDRNVYIFVNGELISANSYLEEHYTLMQLADLFNPRY